MDRKETIDDYDVQGTLGRGAYGEVILAKKKGMDQLFAIKV